MARLPVALAACLLSVAACGTSPVPSGTTEPSVIPTASTSPTDSPTASPSPSPVTGWFLLPTQASMGAAHLKDIATFRGALVVIGSTDPGVNGIWSSTDAMAWMSIAAPAVLAGFRLMSIAVGDPGIVIVGESDTAAIAVVSADGIAWSRHVLPNSHRGSSAVSVAWARGRYLAVGGGGEVNATVAWTSVDGLVWAPLPILTRGEPASLSSVAAGPSAFVIDGMEGGQPVIWTSRDARTWTKDTLPGSPNDDAGRMRYTGGRFIFSIIGGGLWSSTDGQHWANTVVPGFGVGAFDVTAIPGGFVAVGRSFEDNQPGAVAVADANLTHWRVLPSDPVFDGGIAASVTVSPDGAYVVGVGFQIENRCVFLFADPSRLLTQ
ncbi:MAG TPA: hypothetical protein VGQ85_05515 [Candidatus Limnocylindrales bacterium]|nr:hypothetical protein [Candidatus Limnocylindrales bacterium]